MTAQWARCKRGDWQETGPDAWRNALAHELTTGHCTTWSTAPEDPRPVRDGE